MADAWPADSNAHAASACQHPRCGYVKNAGARLGPTVVSEWAKTEGFAATSGARAPYVWSTGVAAHTLRRRRTRRRGPPFAICVGVALAVPWLGGRRGRGTLLGSAP